jgi:hypothetical protein
MNKLYKILANSFFALILVIIFTIIIKLSEVILMKNLDDVLIISLIVIIGYSIFETLHEEK